MRRSQGITRTAQFIALQSQTQLGGEEVEAARTDAPVQNIYRRGDRERATRYTREEAPMCL